MTLALHNPGPTLLSLVIAVSATLFTLFAAVTCEGDQQAPYMVPILAPRGTWPAPAEAGLHFGDIRAVVNVGAAHFGQSTSAVLAANSTVEAVMSPPPFVAQIFWRRRDWNATLKGIMVTDEKGRLVKQASAASIAQPCGVVTFLPTSGPGLYYIYYLPYYQTSGGAGLHFH